MTIDAEVVTNNILTLLINRGQSDYIGESISQLQHCLQCAHLADSAGASPETVIAALLHDIGQFLPAAEAGRIAGAVRDMKPSGSIMAPNGLGPDSGSVGRAGHETIGARYLQDLGFSEKVCALVGSHVAAKRYLCGVDPAYHATLSSASQKSLEFQGGPMQGRELDEWRSGKWCEEMVRLRRWDDAAKVVGLDVGTPDRYRDLIYEHLANRSQMVF